MRFLHRGGDARPLPGGTQMRDTAVRAEGGRRLPAPRTPFPDETCVNGNC